jgi:hypothetical protein
MSIIMNFSELPEKDLQAFAEKLVEKINSKCSFSTEVNFKVDEVEADEMTGDLYIYASHDELMEVEREASWQCVSEDDISSPDEPEYSNSLTDDVAAALERTTDEIDGYTVTVTIDDAEEMNIVNVDVNNCSEEDAGIGRYEYWGDVGYDSRPYYEVDGIITSTCSVYLTFEVAPAKQESAE